MSSHPARIRPRSQRVARSCDLKMTRLSVFASVMALLLAAVAGQNTLLARTDARNGQSPVASVISYSVLPGGCGETDLYVMRYLPGDMPEQSPQMASWCA